jgi:rod shape-determining protein MreD
MRQITVVILFFVALVLNETLMPAIAIGGVSPNLLIYFVVFTALFRNPAVAAFTAAAIGLCDDLLIGRYIGLSILSYAFTGYFTAYFRNRFYQENLLMPIIFVFGGSLLAGSLYMVFSQLMPLALPPGTTFVFNVLPQALYDAALTWAVYIPMQFFLQRDQARREYRRYHYRKYY